MMVTSGMKQLKETTIDILLNSLPHLGQIETTKRNYNITDILTTIGAVIIF